MIEKNGVLGKISSNWRIIFLLLFSSFMIFCLWIMLSSRSILFKNGRVDLSSAEFDQNKVVKLDGQWEFYWDRLLSPEDFMEEQIPQFDSFMKVPGAWNDRTAGSKSYPNQGFSTYRLHINYPATLTDPALSIRTVCNAYKLYANGQLIAEVGIISENSSNFKEGEKQLILDLPKDKSELELIIQVANLNYAKGGLRESLVFGSKQVLEQQKMINLALQLLFIGSVIIFGIYYLLIFLWQKKNKTAMYFCILCFITALRSLIWGELPLMIFFPNVSYKVLTYINYITGYNLMLVMILFVLSIFPLEYKKKQVGFILLPSLFFDLLLLITSAEFMSAFTNYLYVLILLQMAYMLSITIKAVLCKRENGILIFIIMCIYSLTINQDILHYNGVGGINLSNMFLYGNFVVIVVMSFVQAKQQANTYKKLILYSENLVEAEISFLQAQIKPHFLYNALDAVANVCEKDGKRASKLIIDLSIYLRRNLEFNSLDKMVTIEKELEFVDTYFNIEQARFGEKIQLYKEIQVPLDTKIPIFILQPLVENAVRHGVSKKPGGGTVTLRISRTNEGISLEIKDNGVGIHGEKQAILLSETRTEKCVGLINIHHRLLRLYGRGLEIRSQLERGTCVRVVIPEGRRQID